MIHSGWQLIIAENKEVREKHGFSPENDAEYYQNGELIQAAEFAIEQAESDKFTEEKKKYPEGWQTYYEQKIRQKSKIEKYVVAGSFYLSEFQRTNDYTYRRKAKAIARKIDKLKN